MADKAELPSEITQGATVRGNEYGWTISSFPEALANAQAQGYACLGGQFQFRISDGGTCEMYWLSADSKERAEDESWINYSHRSCAEVLDAFRRRVSEADFAKEAAGWPAPIDPIKHLVFVAYFVTESDLAELAKKIAAR